MSFRSPISAGRAVAQIPALFPAIAKCVVHPSLEAARIPDRAVASNPPLPNPVRMKRLPAGLIDALVGVGTEVVSLSLQQVRR